MSGSLLGGVGVWSWPLVTAPIGHVRQAVRAIEEMGYSAIWYPESRGREAVALAALILEATSEIKVATGIANIWARDPDAAAGAAAALGEAFPGRFVLGLGVSHAPSVAARGHDYQRPVEAMTAYLDRMEGARFVGPPPEPPVPIVLAALGPTMLRLAGRRTAGAHPYFVPVAHTGFARETMGPGPILAPEQAVVLEADAELARATARAHMAPYLGLDNYRRNLLRLGWTEKDLDESSDRLVDAIVAWGDPERIAQRLAEHQAAGADHVSIQVLDKSGEVPLRALETLAEALL